MVAADSEHSLRVEMPEVKVELIIRVDAAQTMENSHQNSKVDNIDFILSTSTPSPQHLRELCTDLKWTKKRRMSFSINKELEGITKILNGQQLDFRHMKILFQGPEGMETSTDDEAVDRAKRVLVILGKLAWQRLKEPGNRKRTFKKAEVLRVAGAEALELLSLFKPENLTPQEEETDVLSFPNLMLQEFVAAFYVAQLGKEELEREFPTWESIAQDQEVFKFARYLSRQYKVFDALWKARRMSGLCWWENRLQSVFFFLCAALTCLLVPLLVMSEHVFISVGASVVCALSCVCQTAVLTFYENVLDLSTRIMCVGALYVLGLVVLPTCLVLRYAVGVVLKGRVWLASIFVCSALSQIIWYYWYLRLQFAVTKRKAMLLVVEAVLVNVAYFVSFVILACIIRTCVADETRSWVGSIVASVSALGYLPVNYLHWKYQMKRL